MGFDNPWGKNSGAFNRWMKNAWDKNQWGQGEGEYDSLEATLDAVESSAAATTARFYSYSGVEWSKETGEKYIGSDVSGVYVFDLKHQSGRNGEEEPKLPLFAFNPVHLKAPDGTDISPVDFDHLGALVCGESGGQIEGFKFTPHMVQNMIDLRYYASNTPNLSTSIANGLRSDLGEILNMCIRGMSFKSIADYASKIGWKKKKSSIKEQAMKAAIAAVNRVPSESGDGGLLQGLWHPDDPTRGAVQWKGSIDPIGPNNSQFKTRDDFEKYYSDLKEYDVAKWDTTGRFFYYTNGAGAVWEKYTDEWVDAMVEAAGGGPAYQEAQRRARGTF